MPPTNPRALRRSSSSHWFAMRRPRARDRRRPCPPRRPRGSPCGARVAVPASGRIEMASFKVKRAEAIRTRQALRNHLADACRLEMSTIPVYLYTLYSLKQTIPPQRPTGAATQTQLGAYETLRTVAIEEMLHLVLARNLLTAVGGDIAFHHEEFIPRYPSPMLHRVPRLELRLARCSPEQIEAFMAL